MALFAAYTDVPDEETENTPSSSVSTKPAESWLENSSFKIDVKRFQQTELELLHPKHFNDESDEDQREEVFEMKKGRKRKLMKKSKSKGKKKERRDNSSDEDSKAGPVCLINQSDEFTIDKTRTTEFKYVTTISRPSAPRYKIHKYIGIGRERKKKKFKRYYQIILDKHVNDSASDNEKFTRKEFDSQLPPNKADPEENMTMLEEQDLSRQTASFNRELQVDPYSIAMWINYVNFQDIIFNFEKSFKKGSIAKGQRITAERKLAILDKALQHNPDCETLLRMRLDIAVGVFPADELQTQLKKLVDRDSGNIILWQGFIEATQCSMSHCTTPGVIGLYIKCLHTLHTIRRTAKLNRVLLEESILRMLYQCGLFLKQAGLFEQLWTLLRMYLELNLCQENRDNSTFNTVIAPDDKQLIDLEDTVLKSQLPIHELWLRIEKLREASHWLPVRHDCEDPQRLVFSEDVSELIHPITMPGNTFRLTVTILTLLKIPLLPSRHITMTKFGIDYVPWSLDSIETLLPVFYPLYPIDISNKLLLNAQKLAVGPQYLKTLPGQEEYLQFILNVMTSCSICLNGRDKIALIVWRFRFIRLLNVLEKRHMFKVTSQLKKQLKSEMKATLKGNPTSMVLFREYALVEVEIDFDVGLNILKSAMNMSCDGSALFDRNLEERAAIIAALRTFIGLLLFRDKRLQNDTKQLCLKYICSVILGIFTINTAPRFITQGIIDQARLKFTEINEQLLTSTSNDNFQGADYFLPDFTSEWLILNAYFLYLNSFSDARVFIENILQHFENTTASQPTETNEDQEVITKSQSSQIYRKELLYEFMVAILYKVCVDIPGAGMYLSLDKYLQLGIEKYPNNIFLLTTLAKVQSFHSNYGQPWWKMQSLLLKSGHALSTLFAALIANLRINDIESNWVDTVTGKLIETDNTIKNRMLSLFKRMTKGDMCTRRCGLVWRLYLQFLHAYFEPKVCRDAYYLAVEECPWLKSLYIDAAIYIPEDLAQIQDLIIEKQLRIHVTPEELDVLRS